MADKTITLYGFATSPFVMKVKAYLEYKRIPYGFCPVRPRTAEQIAFTGQKKVPVLKVDDEWRTNSSDLGIWLEELFPKPRILGKTPDARDEILKLDHWVTNRLIPTRLRENIDWYRYFSGWGNGWRQARIINSTTPIPWYWRYAWPIAIQRAPSVWKEMEKIDRRQPLDALWYDVLEELEDHLADGPFMGGFKKPTLADLSAYPVLIAPWLMGHNCLFRWLERDRIIDWMSRVQSHLPDNPLPCDDQFILRDFPF